MYYDVKNSIQRTLREKIISPFSGTFFFAWSAWNWRMLYYLLFSDGTKLQDKINFVNSNYINYNNNFLYPFLSTIGLILIYPSFSTLSLYIWLRYKKSQADLKNDIERKQLLSFEESVSLRQEYKNLKDEFANIIKSKDEELKIKAMEMGLLTEKFDTEKRGRESANQEKVTIAEQLEEKIIEIDKLTKELGEERNYPKIKLQATGRVTSNAEEELLNLPLSTAALEEYTSNKFRGLAVSRELQNVILRDIKVSDYPTIRDIDNAVNRAIPALVAYQLESPKMFEWGTDYISKALGFMDENFRSIHRFSNDTRKAFTRYANLVNRPNGKIETKSEEIPINDLWEINHWHSNCASIVGDKMIFSGLASQNGEDGSNINLYNKLEIGNTYEISCFAKSKPHTTAMFRLWCHDKTGISPYGVNITTNFKTPSSEGEKIKLHFKAEYNKNIRIHLQYKAGQGAIEISDVRIKELKDIDKAMIA